MSWTFGRGFSSTITTNLVGEFFGIGSIGWMAWYRTWRKRKPQMHGATWPDPFRLQLQELPNSSRILGQLYRHGNAAHRYHCHLVSHAGLPGDYPCSTPHLAGDYGPILGFRWSNWQLKSTHLSPHRNARATQRAKCFWTALWRFR